MVASNRVALRGVDVQGPVGAHAIVFVHASGWSRKFWTPQMRALSDRYRVVAMDLPEHGDCADIEFSLASAEEVVHAAVEASGASRVLLVGHSLGGYVAMAYAHEHPERLAGLIAGGCSVSFMGILGLLTRISAAVDIVALKLSGGVLRSRLVDRQIRHIRAKYPPELARALIEGGVEPAAWGHAMQAVVPHDYDKLLENVTCPILVINGELDNYNRRAQDRQAERFPNVEVHAIIGAGHVCSLSCPEAFTDEVRSFAERLSWDEDDTASGQ